MNTRPIVALVAAGLLAVPATAAAAPPPWPNICFPHTKTDCTRVNNHENSSTHIRAFEGRNATGVSLVLYPGETVQQKAGMTDWGSVRVPMRVDVVRFTVFNETTRTTSTYRWKPTEANRGVRNLPDPGKYTVIVKTWVDES